jgi:hypothetical protein
VQGQAGALRAPHRAFGATRQASQAGRRVGSGCRAKQNGWASNCGCGPWIPATDPSELKRICDNLSSRNRPPAALPRSTPICLNYRTARRSQIFSILADASAVHERLRRTDHVAVDAASVDVGEPAVVVVEATVAVVGAGVVVVGGLEVVRGSVVVAV